MTFQLGSYADFQGLQIGNERFGGPNQHGVHGVGK